MVMLLSLAYREFTGAWAAAERLTTAKALMHFDLSNSHDSTDRDRAARLSHPADSGYSRARADTLSG